jgi:hypothetical protein
LEAFKQSQDKDAKLAGQTAVIAQLKEQLAAAKGKKGGGAEMVAATQFTRDIQAVKEEKTKEVDHYKGNSPLIIIIAICITACVALMVMV